MTHQHLESTGLSFQILHEFPPADTAERWREFLGKTDTPSAYDAPDFFDEPHWEGRHPFAVLALTGNTVVGVVTGLHQAGHVICGRPARPQICIDSTANVSAVHKALWEGLLLEAGDDTLIDVFTWSGTRLSYFEQHGFTTRDVGANVVLDLSLGVDALFKQFHENRKRNIRAAVRNGIEVVDSTSEEDVEAHYAVHCAWQLTQRKKIHSSLSLGAARRVQALSGTHHQFLARYHGQVIAATTVRFYPKGLIEYSSNCSLDAFMHLRPNDLLIWRTIQWACEHGFKKYSLGASHPFLQKCGGVLVPISRYRFDRTFLHRHNLRESVADLSRTVLRHAPMPVAELMKRAAGKAVEILHITPERFR